MIELPVADYQALLDRITSELQSRAAAVPGQPRWGKSVEPQSLAAMIEHTCLRPDATAADIARLCAEARQHRFGAVCVQPTWVAMAAAALRDTDVRVAAAIGFPHGATVSTVKCFEASECIKLGADDLDMVIRIGGVKAGDWIAVTDEVRTVAELAHAAGGLLKAILETGYLSPVEASEAATRCAAAGADFVKNATGFGPGAATVEDVRRLRAAVPSTVGIKAAGGIRTRRQAEVLIAAGANRVGTSAGVEIVLASE